MHMCRKKWHVIQRCFLKWYSWIKIPRNWSSITHEVIVRYMSKFIGRIRKMKTKKTKNPSVEILSIPSHANIKISIRLLHIKGCWITSKAKTLRQSLHDLFGRSPVHTYFYLFISWLISMTAWWFDDKGKMFYVGIEGKNLVLWIIKFFGTMC